MSTTRTAGLIGASVGAIFALVGGGLTGVHLSERDRDGYYQSDTIRLHSSGYAATSSKFEIDGLDNGIARDIVGTVRVTVDPDGSRPMFVGIARKSDVDSYLGGGSRPAPPATQSFWRATSSGTGRQTLSWKPRDGQWRLVAMHPGSTAGVDAHAKAGVKTDVLLWIGLPLLGLGLSGLAGGLTVALRAGRHTGATTGEATDVSSGD
jgi:hypothetical protein